MLKKDGVAVSGCRKEAMCFRTGLSATFQCKHGITTGEHSILGLLDGDMKEVKQEVKGHYHKQIEATFHCSLQIVGSPYTKGQ